MKKKRSQFKSQKKSQSISDGIFLLMKVIIQGLVFVREVPPSALKGGYKNFSEKK